MAKISVIIPTYNRAAYIKEAIDSVLAQTHEDIEVIVVDDSSRDGTAGIVSAYGDRVRYILQDNRERGAARNTGIRNSTGEYIAFLDSDDSWLPGHLASCLETLLRVPGAGAAYSGSYMTDETGKIIGKLPAAAFGDDPLREIVSGFSSRGCNASSVLVRRQVFENAGMFSEVRDLSGSEDWEMWTRIAACSKLAFSGNFTAKIRFHGGKSSIDPVRMEKSMKLAMHLVFANPCIAPKAESLKGKAYSGLYTIIAVNYYAAGRMKDARHNLMMALKARPSSLLSNPLLAYTFLRSLTGRGVSATMRKMKWGLGARLGR
ncbi:MAG: glycosyltransferase family A protein [Candidatus Omnitrophota bacterium]